MWESLVFVQSLAIVGKSANCGLVIAGKSSNCGKVWQLWQSPVIVAKSSSRSKV